MPALPEYKTRKLLENEAVPLVNAIFLAAGDNLPQVLPDPPVYLKAQIAGATSRAALGLVRRVDSRTELEQGLGELRKPRADTVIEGVLVAQPVVMTGEYYAACLLDLGRAGCAPHGVLLFSKEGGSGVEGRSEQLHRLPFSLLDPPDAAALVVGFAACRIGAAEATLLAGMIRTFIRYKLLVLEANPIGVLADGSVLVIDCRAEFEAHAVAKADQELFAQPEQAGGASTKLERLVELINKGDPAGTGFVRENRATPPPGAWRVATNLCGGGGKMLWEMTTGVRPDIFSMNESDTSGGLSAFKSYRIARAILSLENAQVFLLTGSGMGFQNQYHLACAIWKALRESPTPRPALLRFGGTDEELARALFERVGKDLPVPVKTFFPHVFPNAMVDEIPDMACRERVPASSPGPAALAPALSSTFSSPPSSMLPSTSLPARTAALPSEGPSDFPVTFSVETPPGHFIFFPERWTGDETPPSVKACPTGFLGWKAQARTVSPISGTRCIGCLACETAALLDGRGELLIRLDLPELPDLPEVSQ